MRPCGEDWGLGAVPRVGGAFSRAAGSKPDQGFEWGPPGRQVPKPPLKLGQRGLLVTWPPSLHDDVAVTAPPEDSAARPVTARPAPPMAVTVLEVLKRGRFVPGAVSFTCIFRNLLVTGALLLRLLALPWGQSPLQSRRWEDPTWELGLLHPLPWESFGVTWGPTQLSSWKRSPRPGAGQPRATWTPGGLAWPFPEGREAKHIGAGQSVTPDLRILGL